VISLYISWWALVLSGVGRMVRVKPEVEEIVRLLAHRLGYEDHTIRNTALVYGLIFLSLTKAVPRSDDEFIKMLNVLRYALNQFHTQTQVPLFR